MVCNLVKKKVKVHLEKDNKDVVITNFYLTFDNGEIVPVECKYYTTHSQDKKDIDRLNKLNSTNFVKFSTLATLLDDESK